MKRTLALAASLACAVSLLSGCEERFFKAQGVVASDGGQLSSWSRPVQGCSPDPLDGQPVGKSATLFTLYWDNPEHRRDEPKRKLPPGNQLKSIQIARLPDGLAGSVKTTLLDSDVELNGKVCSTLQATTTPGKPVIAGGKPTVDGTLDLDCRVADSHLTASVRFTGCEY